MRQFLLAIAAMLAAAHAPAADRPNVVVILADDQGWGDLSVHGNTNLNTPNVDSLARDGALFERFYVCPVCSPTRAEFLTGRYHVRGGVHDVSTGGERLNLNVKTIADAFKAAGYVTGAFGKWHNGSQYPYHPNGRGFDEYYGFTSGHWGDYFSPPLEHNGRPVTGAGYITDDLTDHAIAFLAQHRDRPAFCYLPFNTPHSPMQVPDKFWDKFKDAEIKMRHDGRGGREDLAFTRAALAMLENIDLNVGRVLKRLDELKLADNTIVLYFSDNGPNSWRWNSGMRGRKGSTDEGGVYAPLLVRWPGHIKPGTRVREIAGVIDLLPTLCDLCGVRPVGDKPLDGMSVAPLLVPGPPRVPWPERMIFSHWGGNVSVRTQQYRLDGRGRLYDMTTDPGQEHDITKDRQEVAKRLTEVVAQWKRETLSELPKIDDRPFPVGYREMPITTLPARDGVPHGGVRRSASAPNCSYFTHWTSPDDSITWNVEVATAGRYEAIVNYTCPAADVGSVVALSGNCGSVSNQVNPNDPPLRGAEHDRLRRAGESYVKDFKPLRLGILTLERGRGTLTLRAARVPGRQVMDARSVVLTLLNE